MCINSTRKRSDKWQHLHVPVWTSQETSQPIFMFCVPCCNVCYHKNDAQLVLPSVICRRAHVLFTLFVFICQKWCPTNIVLCFLFGLSSCCALCIASFFGLSILDFPFCFLQHLFKESFNFTNLVITFIFWFISKALLLTHSWSHFNYCLPVLVDSPMGQLTGTINAISICQIIAYIIYSVCLIGIFEWCYVVMETTKYRSATKKTRNHNFIWIAPGVMSGKWSVVGYQSSKWKYEFTGLNQILEFIIYISKKKKCTRPNKFY